MTLTSAIPEISIIALCIAVAATILALFGVILYLSRKEPAEPHDEAQLYLIHERMAHLAESTSARNRRAA